MRQVNLWEPEPSLSHREDAILKRLKERGKLFAFLRLHRLDILDEAFQVELDEMYRRTGAGKVPVAPGLLAMATLLQVYTGASDHEVVELTADSARWQMVLGRLGEEEPAFSQGALYDFRQRLMVTEMDDRLLERSIEVARKMGGFSDKALRAAVDSSPLFGHGRVEDTFNLLAHAARQVLACVAAVSTHTVAAVVDQAELSLFGGEASVKALLDVDWSDASAKHEALQRLFDELVSLQFWIGENLPLQAKEPPLSDAINVLEQLLGQDIEPDPDGGVRIVRGVAADRRISVEDGQMRHGRKSAQRRVDGYKRHIAVDLDEKIILAVGVTPANLAENTALSTLLDDVENQGRTLVSLYIDRGYLGSPSIPILNDAGTRIVCKPWPAPRIEGRFSKRDFHIDIKASTARCPAGQTVAITPGTPARFPAQTCHSCHMRERCTTSERAGRTLSIHAQEPLLQTLVLLQKSPEGRQELRDRVPVENALAHISQRQGNKARYNGVRKNLFHLRLVSAVNNFEAAARFERAAAELQQAA